MTTDLAERYGTSSPVRRRLGLVALALVVTVLTGWLVWATAFHANPAVESAMSTFDIADDHRATAVVSVALEDDVIASCTLRAVAEDHSTVGELAFEPVDGRNEVAIRTERRATTVTLLGCTAPGQPRAR